MSPPLSRKASTAGARYCCSARALLGENRRLLDAAANEVAGRHREYAEKKRHAPPPCHERISRHVCRQRQEDGGGEDLTGLHSLESEARIESAMAERRVLENHRARAGDFAGHRESLNQAQDDEQRRRKHSRLRVRRQQPHGHGGATHQEHATDEHLPASTRIAPVPEDEGPYGPGDVADTVGGKRRRDRNRGVIGGKEELRKDERRRRGIDEEVVVLECRADPPRCHSLPRLGDAVHLIHLATQQVAESAPRRA